MKKLLVIGAGNAQVEAIRRAQELGVEVLAMDGDPSAPGLKVADSSLVVDIVNSNAVVSAAGEHRIDGVLCFAVEAAVVSVAKVAEALGLPGLSVEAAKNATSKSRMRKLWEANNIPSCKYKLCRSMQAVRQAMEIFSLPVIIKPADCAGSRGVMFVKDDSVLEVAYKTAKSFSQSGEVLIEEFMDGEEMSVEGFVYNGIFHVTGLSDKVRTAPPYLLDLAVFFPSIKSEEVLTEAVQIVNGAIKTLGLDMTPVHAELIITENGPKMVEIAARGPGFMVFPTMIPWCSGVNVIQESIRIALGEPPDLRRTLSRGAALVFPQAHQGRVKSLKGLEMARAVPYIWSVELYVKPGDIIRPLKCGSDRVGHIIALADNRETAEKAARQAENLLRFNTDPIN